MMEPAMDSSAISHPPHPERPVGMRQQFGMIVGALVLGIITLWAFTGPSTEATTTPAGIRVGAGDAYNPVLAGEQLPDGFRQLLPRDAIRPIYDPTFVSAQVIAWPSETDVIGVSLGGESKAYPVSFLGGRELVIDELGGIPILVSW